MKGGPREGLAFFVAYGTYMQRRIFGYATGDFRICNKVLYIRNKNLESLKNLCF